jgi:sugar phosphate isomerase/epimerase
MNKKLTIMGYSFNGLLNEGRMEVYHFLETVRNRYHIDAVDIWSGFIPNLDEAFAKKIKKSLNELDLTVANLCIDGPYVPWARTKEEIETNYKNMLDFIKFASIIGAKTIRVDFCPWGVRGNLPW